MYPIPTPHPFYGDKAFALKFLKGVDFTKHRYICIAIKAQVRDVYSPYSPYDINAAQELAEWVQDQISPSYSYEGWLGVEHGIGSDELNLHTEQPERLLASRKAWVEKMVAYLENGT